MGREWYARTKSGEVHGPMTTETLRKAARAGKIERTTEIREGSSDRWRPAHEIKGLEIKPPPLEDATAANGAKTAPPREQEPVRAIEERRQRSDRNESRAPKRPWTLCRRLAMLNFILADLFAAGVLIQIAATASGEDAGFASPVATITTVAVGWSLAMVGAALDRLDATAWSAEETRRNSALTALSIANYSDSQRMR